MRKPKPGDVKLWGAERGQRFSVDFGCMEQLNVWVFSESGELTVWVEMRAEEAWGMWSLLGKDGEMRGILHDKTTPREKIERGPDAGDTVLVPFDDVSRSAQMVVPQVAAKHAIAKEAVLSEARKVFASRSN